MQMPGYMMMMQRYMIQKTFRNLLNVLIQEVTRFFVNKRKHLVICGHSLGDLFTNPCSLGVCGHYFKHFLITFEYTYWKFEI